MDVTQASKVLGGPAAMLLLWNQAHHLLEDKSVDSKTKKSLKTLISTLVDQDRLGVDLATLCDFFDAQPGGGSISDKLKDSLVGLGSKGLGTKVDPKALRCLQRVSTFLQDQDTQSVAALQEKIMHKALERLRTRCQEDSSLGVACLLLEDKVKLTPKDDLTAEGLMKEIAQLNGNSTLRHSLMEIVGKAQ